MKTPEIFYMYSSRAKFGVPDSFINIDTSGVGSRRWKLSKVPKLFTSSGRCASALRKLIAQNVADVTSLGSRGRANTISNIVVVHMINDKVISYESGGWLKLLGEREESRTEWKYGTCVAALGGHDMITDDTFVISHYGARRKTRLSKAKFVAYSDVTLRFEIKTGGIFIDIRRNVASQRVMAL